MPLWWERTFGGSGTLGLDGGSRIIQTPSWAAVNGLEEGLTSHADCTDPYEQREQKKQTHINSPNIQQPRVQCLVSDTKMDDDDPSLGFNYCVLLRSDGAFSR